MGLFSTSSRRRRRWPALALAVCAASGCASSAVSGSPDQVVGAVPDLTTAGGVAAVAVDLPGVHAEGFVDWTTGRVDLTSTESSATLAGRPATQVRVVDGTTWTRPVGAPRWKVVEAPAPGLLSLPGGLRSGDPVAALDLLRGSASVRVFGGLQVRDGSTIRYDVRADPQAAAARAPGGPTGPRGTPLSALAAAASAPVRVDVYVDGSGRARRFELAGELTSQTPVTRDDGARIVTTIDVVAFDAKVQITAPAEADVDR